VTGTIASVSEGDGFLALIDVVLTIAAPGYMHELAWVRCMAALLTRMLSWPNSLMARSTSALQCPSTATSD
jgi:hypothetical protein